MEYKPETNPVIRRVLKFSVFLIAVLIIMAVLVGLWIGGAKGMWSAVFGVGVGAALMLMTPASIHFGNRIRDVKTRQTAVPAILASGFLIKIVVLIVLMFALRSADWLNPKIFGMSLIIAVVASILIDILVMIRTRQSILD